jgi:hypothetical protein
MSNRDMTQAERAPRRASLDIHPGTIVRGPTGDEVVLVSESETHVCVLLDGHHWRLPRSTACRVLAGLLVAGYGVAGAEDPAVLAERVELARAEARARRAA